MGKKRYRGCLVHKLVDTKTYSGEPDTLDELNQVSFDEARKMLPHMKGTKLCANHDESFAFGQIVDANITPEGAFECEFELDCEHNIMADFIEQNAYVGLSLSHTLHSCKPVEVSICWKGARENTWVYPDKPQANVQDYIVKQPNEIVIRASFSEANRVFNQKKMSAVPAAAAEPRAVDTGSDSEDEQTQTQPQVAEPQVPKPEAEAQTPALEKLFKVQKLSEADKIDLCKYVAEMKQKSADEQRENERLKAKVQQQKEKMKEIAICNKHSSAAVLKGLESLGIRIDSERCAQMQAALENSPDFMKSGLPDVIIQASYAKAAERMKTLEQEKPQLSAAEVQALGYYKQFLANSDSNAMAPSEPVVRASAKRPYSHTVGQSTNNTNTRTVNSMFSNLNPAIAELLNKAPAVGEELRMSQLRASGQAESKRQCI